MKNENSFFMRPLFSYFGLAFGKSSGLNLVIKKSAVDLAKYYKCAVLHKGQIKEHRQFL